MFDAAEEEDYLFNTDVDSSLDLGKPTDILDVVLILWIQLGRRYLMRDTAKTPTKLAVQLIPTVFVTCADELLELSSDPSTHGDFMRSFRRIAAEALNLPPDNGPFTRTYFRHLAPTVFYRVLGNKLLEGGAPHVRSGSYSNPLPRGWASDKKVKSKHSDGTSTFYLTTDDDQSWLSYVRSRCGMVRPYWNVTLEEAQHVFRGLDWNILIWYNRKRLGLADVKHLIFTTNTTEKGPCICMLECNQNTGVFNFELQLSPAHGEQDRWRRTLTLLGARHLHFHELIRELKKMGGGNFSRVYKGRHAITGEEVVVKAVEKRRLQQANAFTEVLALRRVSHPAIVAFRAAFHNTNTVVIVTELLRGGDLCEYIKTKGPLREEQAREAIKRILQALVTLHKNKIVHRDLKTENVMLKQPGDAGTVCIIDFGLSATLNSHHMSMRCGSPGYVAPEVLLEKGQYGDKCDVFSAGVVLYTMLTGKSPFRGEDAKSVLRRNARAKIMFPEHLSYEAKSLISWMTQRRPDLRCTSSGALRHPFVTGEKISNQHPLETNAEETCLRSLPASIMSTELENVLASASSTIAI